MNLEAKFGYFLTNKFTKKEGNIDALPNLQRLEGSGSTRI